MGYRLVTPRLVLRPARKSDAEPLFQVFSGPLYMRYGAALPHRDLDETRDWVSRMMAMTPEDGCDFIVEHQGTAIGKCGIWRWPEIGYGIHPDYWGRGLAGEAVAAATAHIFAIRPPLAEITAKVDPRHDASIKLLTRLGFRKTGQVDRAVQVAGEWLDTAYFALARPDA